MGTIVITILITVPTLAVLIWIGLTYYPKLADSIGCSALAYSALRLKVRILAGLATLLNRLDDPTANHHLKAVLSRTKSALSEKADSAVSSTSHVGGLNCRVRLGLGSENALNGDAFIIEICGTIHSPDDKQEATLKVTILDVTDSAGTPNPVLAKTEQWRIKDSGEFCYTADLGKLTGRETILSNWTNVGKVQTGWLVFARKGPRRLHLRTSILSRRDSHELARAEYTFPYDNEEPGYIDMEENRQRTKTLAVALAFTVSASDGKMFNCEVDLIKEWARNNISLTGTSSGVRRKLEKALNKTFIFFRNGNRLDTREICRELLDTASRGEIYDIMSFCLRVAQAKGSAAPEELAVLGDLAAWLEIDPDVYRAMMERTLPVGMHQVKNAEIVLGVTPDMTEENARRHLNKQYSKWNARVTNRDPQIQAQADQMLSLIADARRQYVG